MIGILGGGISGLLVARELEARGLDWRLFEASGRAGGVIWSGRVKGRVLDWGPQRTRLVGPVHALVGELGLEDRVITAEPDLDLFVYRDERLRAVPFGVKEFLASDVVGSFSKLRLLMEPLTGGARPGETVESFFVRKFGRETYATLLGPLFGGLYASNPVDMEAERMLVPLLRKSGSDRSLVLSLLRKGGALNPPPACSFDEGMQVMADALAERLGDRVRLDDPVKRLFPSGNDAASGWRVEAASGTHHCEQLVMCLPAGAAAKLMESVAPEVSSRIGSLRYNPLAVVHLDVQDALEGMGFQVAFGQGLALKGVTYNASLFGRDGVHTAYLGGAQNPGVVDLEDGELVDLTMREFERVTGRTPDGVLDVTRIGMPAWDLSWRALDGLELPEGLHLATNWESRPGLPGRFARARAVAVEVAARRDQAPSRHNAAA